MSVERHKWQVERRARQPVRLRLASRLGSRAAITLTEVLISMGILTLGLLGVAALFPVGGFYMQKAEISDRGSAIAQQAMNDLVARGMLNPVSWQTLVTSPPISNVDGPNNSFTRPLGRAMSQEMYLTPYLLQPAPLRPKYLAQRFGSAYVIDPRGIAATTFTGASPLHRLVATFPVDAYNALTYYSAPEWQTWSSSQSVTWPIRRVTFGQPDPMSVTGSSRMDAVFAETFFSGHDDVAIDLPERDDRPSVQPWDVSTTSGSTMPLSRQWSGEYSWLATVVPTTSAAHGAIGRNPEPYEYDVSVVVFYKRAIPATSPQSTQEVRDAATELQKQERIFKARVISSSLSGGELLLESARATPPDDQFNQLKAGEWLAVCGPHPASTDTDPRFVLKWYQVMAIDGQNAKLDWYGRVTTNTSEPDRRLITLRGPQLPWLPANDPNDLSNNLCVGLAPGAVAVHTKTLRLEGPNGSAWGGAGSGVATSAGPATPPPWWHP